MSRAVWYVAYGSNLDPARFSCYIEGGCPPGSSRQHTGCRDRTPPQGEAWASVPGHVGFARRSPTWQGGGVAFLKARGHALPFVGQVPSGHALLRLHQVTTQQFLDIATQENGLSIGSLDDLPTPLLDGTARHRLPGRTWYRQMLGLGTLDRLPVLSFTAPWPLKHRAPSPEYLERILVGVREATGADHAPWLLTSGTL